VKELGKDRVKEIGEEIVSEIKKLNNPYIEDAILDDFNNYSGQIYVDLAMKESGVGITKRAYRFEENTRPLRKISRDLHRICKKMYNTEKAICYNFQIPEANYEKTDWGNEFLGYGQDYIMFDYDIL